MNLDRYRKLRKFNRTPEPEGSVGQGASKRRFSVQKHDASRLHYDLRIEFDGVLKSWAIPKGPSLDPAEKRLAIQTEDHPIEYGEFEGVIPKGEYGGGTVLLWDQGIWEPVNENGFESGDFKFRLHGEKLRGGWMLVHTGKRRGDPKHWLLFKERDEEAVPVADLDILDSQPFSVLTGRNLEAIASNPNAVWKAGELQMVAAPSELTANPVELHGIRGPKKGPFSFSPLIPALPTATKRPPQGPEWVHEIKYDGYRMLCHVLDGKVVFNSRNGKNWTDKLQFVATQVANLKIPQAILDGEITAVDQNGVTDFQLLQNMIGRGSDYDLKFYVFDILHLNGFDVHRASLLDRKSILEQLLPKHHPVIIYSEHLTGSGNDIFAGACQLGAEGIVSKRVDRPYIFGRSDDWLKTKRLMETEFVVGGFTKSDAGREFAALVIGRFDAHGNLLYEGRVGTGFNDATLTQLGELLREIEIDESPFANLDRDAVGREFCWVRPHIVIGIEFGGWTNSQHLRFPSYRGLRTEVDPGVVFTDRDHKFDEATIERPKPAILQIPEQSLQALANVRFTNPERLMFPKERVTKLDVAKYMAQVAEWMLPFVVNRPLALVRCPKGCNEKCFYQKKPPAGMPECVELVEVTNDQGKAQYAAVIRDIEGLLTLTQFSALEIHNWGCQDDRPGRPDMVVFDIDPDDAIPFDRVCNAAYLIKEELSHVGLEAFVKTSGGKGLHVVLPIRRRPSWDDVGEFCDRLVGSMASRWPRTYTNRHSKSARKSKIYVDVLRNRFGSTAISPFSTRARDGGPVAMPIEWENLSRLKSSRAFTVQNAIQRLSHASPWSGYFDCKQSLTKKIIHHWG